MTKQDLKDGMIVTYRSGETRFVFNNRFFKGENLVMQRTSSLQSYNVDLTHVDMNTLDIIKIEYDGCVIWQRPVCVSFIEAITKGQVIANPQIPLGYTVKRLLQIIAELDTSTRNTVIESNDWIIIK